MWTLGSHTTEPKEGLEKADPVACWLWANMTSVFRLCFVFKITEGYWCLCSYFSAFPIMIPFISAEAILSCRKTIKNGILSAPWISDTASAQTLSAIVFLTVTRHSVTQHSEPFCSPAPALNENGVCFRKKKLCELISAQFKPGDTEARTGAHIYEKTWGGERIRCSRERKILFIFQEGVMNSREEKNHLTRFF